MFYNVSFWLLTEMIFLQHSNSRYIHSLIVFLVQTVKYFQTAHVSKGTLPDDKNNNYFLEINKPLNRQAKTVRGFWLLMKSFTVIMCTEKKVQLYFHNQRYISFCCCSLSLYTTMSTTK